jgi:fatty-acyl-CoA synthase
MLAGRSPRWFFPMPAISATGRRYSTSAAAVLTLGVLPDDVVFVEELPHTATGKLQKVKLREMFGGYRFRDG